MRLISVVNGKGGVGKTTIVMSLAAVLAEVSRVLVVDNDYLQNSATWWSERAGENLPFDFARGDDPSALKQLRSLPYDIVIVDTPGNLKVVDELKIIVEQSDNVLVPMKPEAMSVKPTAETIKKVIEPTGVDYRVLINEVDPRIADHAQDAQVLVDQAGWPRLQNYIRSYKVHSDAPAVGNVATQYEAARTAYKATEDFRRVALEIQSLWARPAQPAEVH